VADFNADPNPMPEVKLGLAEFVCGCIGRLAMLPASSELCLAEHQPRPVAEPNPQGVLDFPEGFGF